MFSYGRCFCYFSVLSCDRVLKTFECFEIPAHKRKRTGLVKKGHSVR